MKNKSIYWFPAKKYGWGWGIPCSWQGWIVAAFFALLFSGSFVFPLDTELQRLFVGCHNRLMVILNTESGEVVTALRIGESVDANVSDKETQQIFSSQNDGTLTIIKEQSADLFIVQQNATTQHGADDGIKPDKSRYLFGERRVR